MALQRKEFILVMGTSMGFQKGWCQYCTTGTSKTAGAGGCAGGVCQWLWWWLCMQHAQ